MTKIVNLFGIDIAEGPEADWKSVVSEQNCPFSGKKCFKVRKSQPSVSIGTCTVIHGKDSTPMMICPNRLLEKQKIFMDCLHLLQGHLPGNELHVIREANVPGGSIDYFLVSVLDGRVKDFVGIELQTLDTTGTVWPERQRLLRELGIVVDDADIYSRKSYGMNWKMTAKTILMQLHHKIRTFEDLNKHLVLVTQDVFLAYLRREFRFEHVAIARNSDSMQFHSYSLTKKAEGHRIALKERFSTDAGGLALCLGLQAGVNVELAGITAELETKISEATLLQISR